jgi:hypothetical protein
MIKNFNELSQVEVKITKKPTFRWNNAKQDWEEVPGKDIATISWVDCLKALYENGAEKVEFEHVPNSEGGLIYKDENNAIHMKVYVDIDGVRKEIIYPVIDGSKNISLAKLKQSDIYNAKQRAFVKCVAVNWGLGINIWTNENNPDDVNKIEENISVYEYFRNLVNSASKVLGSVPEMLKHLQGVTDKKIKELIASAQQIDGITKTLEKVLVERKNNNVEEDLNDKKSK